MPLKLSAGDFKKKVVFKKPTTVKNSEGGMENDYSAEILTWAAEREVDQKRVMEAGGTAFSDTRLMYVRYSAAREAIKDNWLLEIDGIDYTINSRVVVTESGLKVFEITAKAKHG